MKFCDVILLIRTSDLMIVVGLHFKDATDKCYMAVILVHLFVTKLSSPCLHALLDNEVQVAQHAIL